MLLNLQTQSSRRLGLARSRVKVLVQGITGGNQIGARRIHLPCQQSQAGIEQPEFEILAQEKRLFGRQQGSLGFLDTAQPHQRASLIPNQLQSLLPPAGPRFGQRPFGGQDGRCWQHCVGKHQFVGQAHQLVELDQQTWRIAHSRCFDAFDVVHDSALQGSEPGLRGAQHPLVRGSQRSQQRLNAARQLRLLLGQADRRFDVHHQVFVTGARQALHQLLQLGTLQRNLTQPGLKYRDTGGRLARQLLSLAGTDTGILRLLAGLGALARQLLLNVIELLPKQQVGQKRQQGQSTACRQPAPGATRHGWASGGLGGGGHDINALPLRRWRICISHATDSIEATMSGRVGRDSCTWPNPATRAANAMRGWVATARACCQL